MKGLGLDSAPDWAADINIKEYIFAIEKRPKMYLSDNNFFELINCINYFISFKKMFQMSDNLDNCFSNEFPKSVCEEYNVDIRYKNRWEHLIYINSDDDNDAMNNFYSLFKTFIKEKGNSIN